MVDYYAILNIEYSATKKEIKIAFRKEAMKWHPDRNSSSNASNRMKIINEAYLILKDYEARERYDKEYKKFQQAYKEEKSNRQEEVNKQDYSIDDDILNDWIKKAKVQAREMVMMSLEDLVGMSKAATSAVWDRTKFLILIVVIGNIILITIR